jgi:hypothetical protein
MLHSVEAVQAFGQRLRERALLNRSASALECWICSKMSEYFVINKHEHFFVLPFS